MRARRVGEPVDEWSVPVTEYWFARRFPMGDRRQAMAPVHWKGFVVTGGFVAAMLFGAAVWAWLAQTNRPVEGLQLFLVIVFADIIWFLTTARSRLDRTKTVTDYKKEKQRV
jgi:hypothetical protein